MGFDLYEEEANWRGAVHDRSYCAIHSTHTGSEQQTKCMKWSYRVQYEYVDQNKHQDKIEDEEVPNRGHEMSTKHGAHGELDQDNHR